MAGVRTYAKVERVKPVWLSTSELKNYIHCSDEKIQQLRDRGKLPAYRIGGKYLYKIADVDRYIERHRIVPTYNN
ncbi:MAG: helix-turn-helix domain-containing protein [Prevotellaceae bacterium]|jgi:excisionase family DNA binding protein|nr:helix-turn-helix domain-containing protein [Prevotellaceae bacterium]